MLPNVVPQLVANDGTQALRQAIADPDRYACEPKVDGVRGLVVYQPERVLEMPNRRGEKREWLRSDAFEAGLRRLADRLPNLWEGTVLDGELIAGPFEGNDVSAARIEEVATIAPVRRIRRAGAARRGPSWPPVASIG